MQASKTLVIILSIFLYQCAFALDCSKSTTKGEQDSRMQGTCENLTEQIERYCDATKKRAVKECLEEASFCSDVMEPKFERRTCQQVEFCQLTGGRKRCRVTNQAGGLGKYQDADYCVFHCRYTVTSQCETGKKDKQVVCGDGERSNLAGCFEECEHNDNCPASGNLGSVRCEECKCKFGE